MGGINHRGIALSWERAHNVAVVPCGAEPLIAVYRTEGNFRVEKQAAGELTSWAASRRKPLQATRDHEEF